MPSNIAHVETFTNPALYSVAEIELACAVAAVFSRDGKLILTYPPRGASRRARP